jgi:hypothetical protein
MQAYWFDVAEVIAINNSVQSVAGLAKWRRLKIC